MSGIVAPSAGTAGRLTDDEVHARSRALFHSADLVLAVVFLSPEAGAPPLGLTPPEFYVASRGAPLGRVPGDVVAATFGLIEPTLVAATWDAVMPRLDPGDMTKAKVDMAEAVLERIASAVALPAPGAAIAALEEAVERADVDGHPLFAAIRSLEAPSSPAIRLWRLCELVREHRGGSHICAYRAAGLSAIEINVLTELWRGVPLGSEATTVNAWSPTSVARALRSLTDRGFADGDAITDAGRAARESIELATSMGERSLIENLTSFTDVARIVGEWADAVRAELPPPYWWHTWKPASPS